MPWKETTAMDQKIEFVVAALRGVANFSDLCRQFEISRPTGYLWVERYREVGSLADLKEKSRRPRHSPTRTPAELEQAVLELRHQYGWGARKLRVLLQRQGREMPETTVHRILKRNGRIAGKEVEGIAVKRFERSNPNDLWQMDFKGEYRCGSGYCHPLSILDDCSRYAPGLGGFASQHRGPVWEYLQEVFSVHGLPAQMLIDHGTPWYGTTNGYGLTRLSVELIRQGIDLIWSGIRHPQTQGKVERFHRSLAEYVRRRGRPQEWSQWPGLLEEFRREYNEIRPHESLQMEVPAQRYQSSPRRMQRPARRWQYPGSVAVRTLSGRGTLYWRRYYFVCEALADQEVGVEEVDGRLLVRYRHLYIREIDLQTHRTRALTVPIVGSRERGDG